MSRLAAAIGVICLLAGCGEERHLGLTVVFPEGAREQARLLRVVSVKPGEGANCQALQAGTAAPGDAGYAREDQAEIDLGGPAEGWVLAVSGAGPRLFYAEAEDAQGLVFVRGCTRADAGGPGKQVTIVLQWVTMCHTDSDCDDDDLCTSNTCSTQYLCETTPVDCSGFGDQCNEGICNSASGECASRPSNPGGPCDDLDPCTVGDACDDGGDCVSGASARDADGDGFVDAACGGGDCDDSNADVNPDAGEDSTDPPVCLDGLDNDCDGFTDAGDPGCAEDWWDTSWTRRRKLTFDNLAQGEDLVDFPVLVVLDGARIDYANTQDAGQDLRFVDSDDSTPLAHEIETWDESALSFVWVNVPQINGSSDQDFIWMYYGNSNAPDGQDVSAVWNPGYQGVWHLKESPDGTPGEIKDSTSNANHGTTEGGMDGGDSVTAKIGLGLVFDEVDDLIRVPDSLTLDSTVTAGTFELWVYWTEPIDGDHQIVMTSSNRYTAGANDGYEWASQGDGDHFFYPWGGADSNYNLGPNPFTAQTWHYLVVTFRESTKAVMIYVDANPMTFTIEGVPANWTTIASPDDWLWGGNPDIPIRYFDGMFDEIRVSNSVRSLFWLQAQHKSMNDDAFVNFGVEEIW